MTAALAAATGEVVACDVDVLHVRVQVVGPPEIVEQLRAGRLSSLHATPTRAAWFRVERCGSRPVRYRLDGPGLAGRPLLDRTEILARLERAINAVAVATLGERYALVHAGAIAYCTVGCLLPAPSGSGKSTLVAALAAAGLSYLSDEVAVLEPGTGQLWPFPKPIGIKAGGRRVLTRTYPALAHAVPRQRIDDQSVWLLPPPPGALPRHPVSVRAVVLPRYVPRGRTVLTRISAADAFPEVIAQVAGSAAHGTRNLKTVAAVLRDARCYRLAIGRLDAAVRVMAAELRALSS